MRAIACALALSALVACVQTGRVPPPLAQRAQLHGALRGGAPLGARGAIVYLEPIAPDALPAEPGYAEVKILRGRFEPDPLVVPRGARVAWRNADSIYHGVFSLARGAEVDLGTFAPGERRELSLSADAPVRVRCPLHVEESGVLLAVPGPHFVHVRARHYMLRDVPPGRYWLHAWSDAGSASRREITLQPGESAHADLTLRGPRP